VRIVQKLVADRQSVSDCEVQHHDVAPFVARHDRVYSWSERTVRGCCIGNFGGADPGPDICSREDVGFAEGLERYAVRSRALNVGATEQTGERLKPQRGPAREVIQPIVSLKHLIPGHVVAYLAIILCPSKPLKHVCVGRPAVP
jgi:hypothetical protein